MTDSVDAYRRHTVCSAPGRMTEWIADAPGDISGLRDLSSSLVFHFRANGDPADHGFSADRLAEIDLRYADEQFARLSELAPGTPLGAERAPTERILGCCRDYSLLFTSLARSRGIASRSRVGFNGYFLDGWWIDHVVAEVWDEDADGWRLVEAQVPRDFVDVDGSRFDLLDVPRDRFLTGADAWIVAREAHVPADRFVVMPDLDLPALRSWPYLAHNLVLDLASLAGHEAILWESWGLLEELDPTEPIPSTALARLDVVAHRVQAGASAEELASLAADPLFAVPPVVTRHSPWDTSVRRVSVRTGEGDRVDTSPSALPS